MESRIRIKTKGAKKPFLSSSGALGCNRYNQGCNGGYPILVAKHGAEFGFYSESCQPYKDHDIPCKHECYKKEVWKVDDYGYVGEGYYGSTNELAM